MCITLYYQRYEEISNMVFDFYRDRIPEIPVISVNGDHIIGKIYEEGEIERVTRGQELMRLLTHDPNYLADFSNVNMMKVVSANGDTFEISKKSYEIYSESEIEEYKQQISDILDFEIAEVEEFGGAYIYAQYNRNETTEEIFKRIESDPFVMPSNGRPIKYFSVYVYGDGLTIELYNS